MLQLARLRSNPDTVKERLAAKYFSNTGLVDKIIALDDERKALGFQFDDTKAKINAASKEIGALMKSGNTAGAAEKKGAVEAWKASNGPVEEQLQKVEAALTELLLQLPNLPAAEVPPGRTPEENEVVRTGGSKPELYSGAVPHWELAKKLDLIDFELGNKITGSGFPVYKGKGAKLQRSLIQYFLEFNTAAGYTEYMPPLMVNEAS
ncbi:MAG TPA: hypothetical protein VM843_08235, partial [Flavisolibacter sp.]|nr:hypothetical protein [Flavisolibacter sp.]